MALGTGRKNILAMVLRSAFTQLAVGKPGSADCLALRMSSQPG
jgi:hypothetical protein